MDQVLLLRFILQHTFQDFFIVLDWDWGAIQGSLTEGEGSVRLILYSLVKISFF